MRSRLIKIGVHAVVTALILSASAPSASVADEEGEPYLGLGHESCRQYLQDVASDSIAQQLYSAWLAGYVTVAYSELSLPQFAENPSELRAANVWIASYCEKRASDTFLTATVRLLMARESNFR